MTLFASTPALVLTSMAAGGLITFAFMVGWKRLQDEINPLTDEDLKR